MQSAAYSLLRLLGTGEILSADHLAAQLGVTRERVARLVAELRMQAVSVENIRGCGYCVRDGMDLLDATAMKQALPFPVDVVDECPSTNSALLANAAQTTRLLVCELQTAGRGRRGNVWRSGLADGLSFSLLWAFKSSPRQLAGLSLAVGVACVRALEALDITNIALKWPNDLMHAHGKLGGILIELKPGTSAAVIGIGLNIRNAKLHQIGVEQPIADLSQIAAALPKRTELLCRLSLELIAVLKEFESHGFAAFREEWSRYHIHAGQRVRLMNGDVQIEGVAQGVSEEGALLLATALGERLFFSGELRRAA